MKKHILAKIAIVLCTVGIILSTVSIMLNFSDALAHEETNYMNLMYSCADRGDYEMGRYYENLRNKKIIDQGLNYSLTNYFHSEDPMQEILDYFETYHIRYYTEDEVDMVAKVLWCECGGVQSTTEQACVAWTICNRVDGGYGSTIAEVVTAPNHFAYFEDTEVFFEMRVLAEDVLSRWNLEKNGITDVGRVLPPDYFWFSGRNDHNWFRNKFKTNTYWDYSLYSPYED